MRPLLYVAIVAWGIGSQALACTLAHLLFGTLTAQYIADAIAALTGAPYGYYLGQWEGPER